MQRSRLGVPTRIFLFSIFGTVLHALLSYSGRTERSLGKWLLGELFFGLVFGVTMALLISWMHRWRTRHIQDSMNLSVRQTKEIDVLLPYDKAFEKCLATLKGMKRLSIKRSDKLGGIIEASSGMNWWSFGEKIHIGLKMCEANKTRIAICSEPISKTTLVDYGRNLENVERISTALLSN